MALLPLMTLVERGSAARASNHFFRAGYGARQSPCIRVSCMSIPKR